MEQGTTDDEKFANEPKDTTISVQSLEKQGQLCVVEDDHHQHSSETTDDNGRKDPEMAGDNESCNTILDSDRQRLLNILPEELWRIVFKKLGSSDDHLEKVYYSSPFFRELLLSRRVTILFKNVWKVMGCQRNKYFAGSSDNALSVSQIDEPEKDIMYEKSEAIKESLPLRLVCQSWRKGIDDFHECRNLKLKARADATALLAHFNTTHGATSSTRNPFLVKSVSICVDRRGIEVVRNGVHALLDKYGRHFSKCSFLISDLLPSVVSFYSRFRMLLPRMPNLKKLRILYKKVLWLTPEEIRILDTEMIFPSLDGLEELSVEGGTLPLPIFRQLMRISGYASTTTSGTTTGATLDSPFVSSLKSLSVLPCPQNYFEIITGYQLQWHLTSLCLILPDCRVTDWPSVFNELKNKFGATLTHLRLTLPHLACRKDGNKIIKKSKRFKIHLSHLIRFQLEVAVENPIMCASENLVRPMTDYKRVLTVFAKDSEEWHVKYSKTWGWQQRSVLEQDKVVIENEPVKRDRGQFSLWP